MNEEALKAKVIVVGSTNVGKTFLIRRFIKGDSIYQQPTINVELETHRISLPDGKIDLQIWDTVNLVLKRKIGEEKYKSLTKNYFVGAELAILVFDVTSPSSKKDVDGWLDIIRNNTARDVIIFLAGNKTDLIDK